MRISARAGRVWLRAGPADGGVLIELTPEMAEEMAGDLLRYAEHARNQAPAASLAGLLARVGTHPGAA